MSWLLENTGENIDHGGDSSLTDLLAGSCIIVGNCTLGAVASGHPARWMTKGPSSHYLAVVDNSGSNVFQLSIDRVTQSLLINAPWANYSPAIVTGTWYFIVSVMDVNGSNTDQKIYVGTYDVPPAEPSSYTTQRVGSGTRQSDSGTNLQVFNNPIANTQVGEGYVAYSALYRRKLKYSEIITLWNAWREGKGLLKLPDAVLISDYNVRTSKQRDISNKRNHGTVTNAVFAKTPNYLRQLNKRRLGMVPSTPATAKPWMYYASRY